MSHMASSPAERLRWPVRGAWGVAGLLWFFWLGYEDRGPGMVLFLAAVMSVAGGLTGLARWGARGGSTLREGSRHLGEALSAKGWRNPGAMWLAKSSWVGVAAGAAVGPLAALLMLLKTSLHNHPYLDFTGADLVAAVSRTPVWAAAGLLTGIAPLQEREASDYIKR